MITRVEADGFKSLRRFAVDLEPLTAIVGANGTGKSNLFDALQLLSRLASTDVGAALAGGRGSRRDQFSRTHDDAGHRMTFALDLLLSPASARTAGPTQTRVRYEVEIDRSPGPSGLEDLVIRRERLVALRQDEDRWMARHPELATMARYGQELTLVERSGSSAVNPCTRAIVAHTDATDPFAVDVGEELRAFRFLHAEPEKLRAGSERAAPRLLASDGSNLPTALAALPPEVRAAIRADMARVLRTFRSFEVVPSGDELAVEVELTDDQRLPARVLSDGTLRLLALFTLLWSSRGGAAIAVEEVENGIHPAGLRALMAELVAATRPDGELPPQVLLSSHAPALVAALHERPDALVFADLIRRGDGLHSTRMRHLWREGDPKDRGATTASAREVERMLETAQPADDAA